MKKFTTKMLIGTMVLSTAISVSASTVDGYEVVKEVLKTENIETKNERNLDVEKFLNRARELCKQEAYSVKEVLGENNEMGAVEPAFVYHYLDEETNQVYIYEQTEGKEAVSIAEYILTIESYASVNLPDGFGGRQKIKANGSTYISGTFELPSAGVVKATGTPYIYAGFTGGAKEGDLGLQWSNNNGGTGTEGWKPYAKVGGAIITDNTGNFVPGYEQVTYKNSYLPGKNVDFYIYSNYNNTGRVRMKTMGYARYSNNQGTGTNTYLTSIVEYSTSVGVPKEFKVLATVAGSESSKGSFTTTISNIKLNGSVPSTSAYSSPEEDYATVTRSGNNIKFTLSK